MEGKPLKIKPFSTKKSIRKAAKSGDGPVIWHIHVGEKKYTWSNPMQRVEVIRQGVPYRTIEGISERLDRPIKTVLSILNIPQTTYNKKKSEHSLLDSRESELIVLLTELIDYGISVFNKEEEKFQRWLKKPNLSLGGHAPDSLLDTVTGIEEVNNCLNRIEFGNFA
ncbi:MAG TPA: antitoxin Xre/MbcA/ParS toxin-binding domain-containing protein [Saprospiraceae bacterium]|nr:antitoxin Xre/MbcA/ParS toxin-binding domain-containing protein [Saprospiraceae bacterium]